MTYDIIIIGGGPGGYVAAIRGAQLGAKVAVIENHKIGGTCLNYGCIPTKAFFKTATLLSDLKESEHFGVKITGTEFDVELLQKGKNEVVSNLTSGVEQLLLSNNVDIYYGLASFENQNTVQVVLAEGGNKTLSAKHIIIATGSKVANPVVEGIDLPGVVTSKELLDFKELPKRLVVLGGGVVAMEFASIFNDFGSEVTVIARSTILKSFDTDVVKRASAYMKKNGIDIRTGTGLLGIEKSAEGLLVRVEGKKGEELIEADLVLSAMGRKPMFDGLNIEAAGILTEKGSIKVDKDFKTNVDGIYAIGDVNGKYMLAHAASHQGVYVVEKILTGVSDHTINIGDLRISKMDIVPGCVFVSPEMASVGFTESDAEQAGLSFEVSKFPFSANGKAMTMRHTDGFVKLVALESGQLIGAQILGAHASDLIHELTLAIANGMSADDVAATVHAHPTLSESVMEAAFGLKDGALHMAPVKKRK